MQAVLASQQTGNRIPNIQQPAPAITQKGARVLAAAMQLTNWPLAQMALTTRTVFHGAVPSYCMFCRAWPTKVWQLFPSIE